MKALDDAIYSRLTGDSTLVALLSSGTAVYPHVAPQNAVLPYVIFAFRDPHEDSYVYTGRAYETFSYLIKGVTGPSEDHQPAMAISERIDALITDTLPAPTGYSMMYRRRVNRVEYPEKLEAGEIFWHAGGVYRIMIDPA